MKLTATIRLYQEVTDTEEIHQGDFTHIVILAKGSEFSYLKQTYVRLLDVELPARRYIAVDARIPPPEDGEYTVLLKEHSHLNMATYKEGKWKALGTVAYWLKEK